jgi:FAD:protein FMN transferase
VLRACRVDHGGMGAFPRKGCPSDVRQSQSERTGRSPEDRVPSAEPYASGRPGGSRREHCLWDRRRPGTPGSGKQPHHGLSGDLDELWLGDLDDLGIILVLVDERRGVVVELLGAQDQPCQAVGHVGRHITVTTATEVPAPPLTVRSFRAIGTTATVVVQHQDVAEVAQRELAAELDLIDAACSRFRHDSELQRVHAASGRPAPVSDLLFEALVVAVTAAARTGGAVDPTVGNALAALGYDADLDEVLARPPAPARALGAVAGYAHVQLNPANRTVRIPRGVRLDLGSTAKAWAADRAAERVARAIGDGALVSLGGDVAAAGPAPAGGWAVGIALESRAPASLVDQVVAITQGGLASSATSARAWHTGGRAVHHIVDPRTGDCAQRYWVLVSATGASCVEANLVTTAAIVWGEEALDKLSGFEQSVRLVRADGEVFSVNGWPLGATP